MDYDLVEPKLDSLAHELGGRTEVQEFIVEQRVRGAHRRLTRKAFDAWLRRPGGSPADLAAKTRSKDPLEDGE